MSPGDDFDLDEILRRQRARYSQVSIGREPPSGQGAEPSDSGSEGSSRSAGGDSQEVASDQELEDPAPADSPTSSTTASGAGRLTGTASMSDRYSRVGTRLPAQVFDASAGPEDDRQPVKIPKVVKDLAQVLGQQVLDEVNGIQPGQEGPTVRLSSAVTGLIVGLTGARVEGLPAQTQQIAEGYASTNPALVQLVEQNHALLEQVRELTASQQRMQRQISELLERAFSTEVGMGYLLASSTGEISVRDVQPETIEVDQPRSLASRDRLRSQSARVRRSEVEKTVREARRRS